MKGKTRQKNHYTAIFLTALSFILVQCIAELVLIYAAIAWSIDIATALYMGRYVLIAIHVALTVWLIVFARAFAGRFYQHKNAA